MFRKLIVATVLAVCATMSFASSTYIDTDGLSEAQIASLKAHAAKAVAEVANQANSNAPSNPAAVMSLAATWGQQASAAAEGFAKALGIAAKELGVTVNDFLHTDAGKLTAILIIWKVAGAAAIKMLYGMLFVTVGLTIVRVIYMRLFTLEYKQVEYSRFFGAFKGTKMVRVPKTIGQFEKDGDWLAFWCMIILTIAVMVFGGHFF